MNCRAQPPEVAAQTFSREHRTSPTISIVLAGALLGVLTACATSGPQTPGSVQAYEGAWADSNGALADHRDRSTYTARLTLLASPLFGREPAELQHTQLLSTAILGSDLKDFARADELLDRATRMPQAGVQDWQYRLYCASMLAHAIEQIDALTRIVQSWPKELDRYDQDFILRVATRSGSSAAERRSERRLQEALYRASWTMDYGVVPTELWGLLAMHLAEDGDNRRALEVIHRGAAPRVLLAIRADRRFDTLVKADPAAFDIEAAAEREIKQWQSAVDRNPRKLDPIVQLTYAYLDAGRYEEVYKITTTVITQLDGAAGFKSLFDDDETSLNWIFDNHARVLIALQKWDDAEWELRTAADRDEHSRSNVSNVINLAQFYADLNRGSAALATLAELPSASANMSPYGRMQWYRVQLCAAVAQNDGSLVESSLAYLREHRADSLQTFQWSLVRAQRDDEAAALLIRRLRDPTLRAAALAAVQRYTDPPAPPQRQMERDRWERLVTRPEVASAIRAVGRVEQLPLPRDSG